MLAFTAATPLDAWLTATKHLLAAGGRDYNVLATFPSSGSLNEGPLSTFDPRSTLGATFDRARDVANTIFPAKTCRNSATRPQFYKRYKIAHLRGRKKSWGTYFHRLIDFGHTNINQLENTIIAMGTWAKNSRAALVMHTSSAELDKLKPLGAPCLQYVQFNGPTSSCTDLLAVFRNHDFTNKALGNYYGLARLLVYVANQAGRIPGSVSCLSCHAYFSASITRQKLLAKIP
jgi:thymidylate synthase